MIYITQLIFIDENEKESFLEFEDKVLPLLKKFKGKLLYRLRPKEEEYIFSNEDKPYEIHIVSFETENDFEEYMNDDERKKYLYLKEKSIKSASLIKGVKI